MQNLQATSQSLELERGEQEQQKRYVWSGSFQEGCLPTGGLPHRSVAELPAGEAYHGDGLFIR